MIFVIGTFGLNFQITCALMAKQVFDQGASGYGWLSTALAVGACAGAVVATRRVRRPTSIFLLVTAVGFGVAEMAAGLMPDFIACAILLVPTGFAMLSVTTGANSAVQLGVEPTMRGRVMSLYLVCFLGGTPFGAPLIGWLAESAGPRWGLIGGGLVCVLSALLIALVMAHHRGIRAVELPQLAVARLHLA